LINFEYAGTELDLFAAVRNWKSYWSELIRPFVRGDVLEVGAGIGSNTLFLNSGGTGRWVCLEPDARLATQLTRNLEESNPERKFETVIGTIQNLDSSWKFDTILYIDVLEHIDRDRQELQNAVSKLRPEGRIIVLSPTHQWLFTPFDAAIGHFRRYDRPMLRAISPPNLHLDRLSYIDSAGLVLSTANVSLLRQSIPTKAQLRIWDQYIIPISRILNRFFLNSVGKSIFGIWCRESA